MKLTTIINRAFNFVITISKRFDIDESHSLKHSMDVFHTSNKIFTNELVKNPYLHEQKTIIYVSAILHDMCDKKYMNEIEGVQNIKECMTNYMTDNDINIMCKIISTMSYSKVRTNGYPNLGKYQLAYHIVREADLLTAYDIERCIIYGVMVEKNDYVSAVDRAKNLFTNRVLKYREDKLFITNYSKNLSLKLHNKALSDLNNLNNLDLDYDNKL